MSGGCGRKRKALTRGPGRSVARGELLADGPAFARERVSRVRRERAAVLGLAPRGLSAGGGKLGRERGLGRPVGLSGNRGKGERAGFGFGFGLGPLSLFHFLFTILLTHTKLNSDKFESKNLFTQTNKEMLQYDATTKLNLC